MDTLKKVVSFHNLRLQRLKNFQRTISWRALPILIVISLLVSLIGLGLPAPSLAQHEGEQTAEFLPPDTDLYFTFNLDPSSDQLTKFWAFVTNWWQDPNIQAKWGEWLEEAQTESDIDIEGDVLPWLGPEIAMGMRNLVPNGSEEPEMIFFVGTMNKDASDAFFFDKLTPYIADEVGMQPGEVPSGTTGDYNGIATLYDFPESGIYWAFPDEYIVLSSNQAFLEESLDLILSPNPAVSLAGIGNFQEAQANLPSERVGMFYCNYEHIWEEFLEQVSEEAQATLEIFSDCIPAYSAVSLYFTDEGISATAYYPIPEGITLPSTEPNLLRSASIIPGDALLFASGQDVSAYWQVQQSYVEGMWEEVVSILTDRLSEMTFEEAVAYLDEALGLNLDELWAEIAPVLGELSGMTFEEAVAYLGELWAGIAPVLGDLSGMTFEEAVAYLGETLGLNLGELWAGIAPVLGELSGMTFEEAVAYLDETLEMNVDELWAGIAPVLGDLSGMTFEEAVAYLDETLGELWEGIAPMLGELSGMTFEEAVAYLDETLGELWEGIAPVLGELSGMTFGEVMAYLDDTLGLNLGELWEGIAPVLGELSDKTFAEAVAYLDETLGLDSAWGEIISVIEKLALESFEEATTYFDQALSEMTGEFSMALLPLSFEQQTPDVLLMLEVGDTGKVQEDLDTVINTMKLWLGLQSSELSIDGVTATIITNDSLAASGVSPGYLFLDVDTTHYLVIGTTTDALQDAVDASQGEIPSLDEAEEYQGVLSLLPETRMDLSYLNITQLLNTIVSQIPTGGMSVEERADFELLVDCIPLKGALAYSSAFVDTDGVTMTGALYLLPPPLIEQGISEGTTATVEIPEQTMDFSQLDIEVGRCAVSIDVAVIDAPDGANIKITAMKELPEEIVSGFELAATDTGVSIVDIAYGIRVDKANLAADDIGTATITMKVGRAWADEYGIDNVRIFRVGDDGAKEVLHTEFTGYTDDQAVFVGTSENGLSYFALAAISEEAGLNWALIGGIIGGVVVVAAVVAVILLRRRRALA